jgi:hypothetical protein
LSAGEQGEGTRPALAVRPRRTVTLVVLLAGLAALLAAGTVGLLQRAPRLAGTNLTADAGFAIALAAGQELCEPGELVPGDTGALKLDASTAAAGGPRLSTTVGLPAGGFHVGGLAAGWHSGVVQIPLQHVPATLSGATVCIRNQGPGSVAFGGSVPDSGFVIQLAGKPLGGRLRIEYMRPGSESWLQLLPTLSHRFSLAKSDVVRHWAAAAAIVLMLLALALSIRTLLREEDAV